MKREGGVHTVPNPNGTGWVNEVDGEVVNRRYKDKDLAVAAGRAMARQLCVEHSIHRQDETARRPSLV